ncbi:hypothetical protein A2755_03940 [Candidatus Wolfebacteria bacterium RIFCSPHIGHO2_01_FULL_48_22]|uniref:Cell envelope-related transcriptional attenuator domain-containing protein n=2 Tax=Candidatus Wolfeibacteriota TaxID=1752735 RepID=A0A1F8DNU9_9BACT|nr:MAG: hypothetical protein A2755_03940 [Candidatus Wolfebacteria bacterium RIFCSPHIGHO2_01_FULL_48_22]OGM93489.1 MAG: hypothetical protein A2935_01290 [Candidatus Wolfebacteria bacterium RIFCSPLOWO2_01_FULL_47_17b]
MKKVRITILIIIGLGIAAFAVYGIAYKLPARSVSWANGEETQSGNIGDFFKNLFTKSDITIVVFGRPGAGYGGGALADAILVVRFNPDTNTAYLVSLPRDLWISDGSEQFKINEAFNKNKVPAVMDKIEKITGFSTNGYVVIDLQTLAAAVDWLGGVDVVLHEPAIDWVSSFRLDPGSHHLNGEDAVWLVRNRHNQQGDFFRESNQHQVVEAMLDKFQELTAEEKNLFLKSFVFKGSFLNNAQIDFSKLTPYLFGTDVASIKFESIVLDFTTKLFTTMSLPLPGVATTTYISVLVPTAGFENYTQIKEFIGQNIDEK